MYVKCNKYNANVQDDPLAAKIRLQLKKRKIDFSASECVNPCSETDPMKKMIVNSPSGVYIPCISSYEKPVTNLMSKEDSLVSKVCNVE